MAATSSPPSQVETLQRGELATLRLAGELSTLEIALQGAQVIDWTRPGTPPVLFLSPHSTYAPGKSIRGGVPLVFPWFGPRAGEPAAPQHGFARARIWRLRSASVLRGGACGVSMRTADDESTRAPWPHAFASVFSASADRQLRMALEIRNTGNAAFSFEAALHTYLCVSDVRRVDVRGLENTEYIDKVDRGVRKREGNVPIAFTGETDRVYQDTASDCVVEDPGWKRRIVVSKSGSRSTVVWNPWKDKSRAMGDLGEDGWTGMLCIETANAFGDARTLAPGETHVLEAVIAVEQD